MIDLCISLNGPNLDLMGPLCLRTLERVNDLSGINLHLVDRGMPANIRAFFNAFAQERQNVFIYDVPQKFPRTFGPGEPTESWSHDTAGICHWMVDNCGTEEWCFLMHFDLAFNEDIITDYVSRIGVSVGQIGEHWTGLVGYRRKALAASGARFDTLDGVRAVRGQHNKWYLRYAGDPRCTGDFIDLGLDVACWIELHLALNGWTVITLSESHVSKMVYHIRCGSDYHGENKTPARNYAEIELKRRNIPPVPKL